MKSKNKAIKWEALADFIEEGEECRPEFILEQIKLMADGVRDGRLADRAITLIRGEINIKE